MNDDDKIYYDCLKENSITYNTPVKQRDVDN